MSSEGAERAARRIAETILRKELSPDWITHMAAIIREETGTQVERELFGRAMVIIKGLTLGTTWEIAPPIKREMEKLCAVFEALPVRAELRRERDNEAREN